MINNQLENQLSILEGSYSDELSFYIMDIAVGGAPIYSEAGIITFFTGRTTPKI